MDVDVWMDLKKNKNTSSGSLMNACFPSETVYIKKLENSLSFSAAGSMVKLSSDDCTMLAHSPNKVKKRLSKMKIGGQKEKQLTGGNVSAFVCVGVYVCVRVGG